MPHGENLEYEFTDAQGTWTRDNLPPGMYTLVVPNSNAPGQYLEITPLNDEKKSYRFFETTLCPGNNEIRVQVIDLDKWFVSKQNSLSKIPQFSRGNIVEPLIDGAEMMAAVYDAFTGTNTWGHYIYIAVWQLNGDIKLLGTARSDSVLLEDEKTNGVLLKAMEKNVEVKALLWDHVTDYLTQNSKEKKRDRGYFKLLI